MVQRIGTALFWWTHTERVAAEMERGEAEDIHYVRMAD